MIKAAAVAAIVVTGLFAPRPAAAYSVLAHEANIDALWDSTIAPMLRARFPQACREQMSPTHRDFSLSEIRVKVATGHKNRAALEKGDDMKSSTKDQVEGKLREMKGKVKAAAGRVTNNPNLTNEGEAEELAGKVQKKVGQVKKVFEK